MKTWRLVLSFIILGLAIWAVFGLLPQWSNAPEPAAQDVSIATNLCRPDSSKDQLDANQGSQITINQGAQIDTNGNPLPSIVQEDVEVYLLTREFTQDISGSFLLYDHDSGNWETQFTADGTEIRLCFVAERVFIENISSWDEVDPALLVDELDVRQYILSTEQIYDFNRQAVLVDSEQTCGNHSCAVWRATLDEPSAEITIRVNKFSRKIVDVEIIDDKGILLAKYSYQPIEVGLPEPVRYLPPAEGDQ